MRIAVVGAGALGSLLAALFAEANDEVWLVAHSAQQARGIERLGLQLQQHGTTRTVRVNCVTGLSSVLAPDWICVCVKAFDTAEAGRALSRYCGPHSTVVTLQNGIGNRAALEQYVHPRQIVVAATALGAYRSADGTIVHAGTGPTKTAPGHADQSLDCAQEFARVLNDRGIPAEVTPDPEGMLWAKLAINAAINPLTALHDVPNGALLRDPSLMTVALEAGMETLAVAAAKGIAVAPERFDAELRNICTRTARNFSSMLQDVRAGKLTEIGQINGAVCHEGQLVGVPTPTNERLVAQIRQCLR